MPLLNAAVVPAPDQVVVRLSGEADLSTVDVVADALDHAAGLGARRVVVEVSRATFWDCSGLRVLAEVTAALARAGRQCRIVGANRPTRRLIALADFAPLLMLDGPLSDPCVARAAEERTPLPAPPSAPGNGDRRPGPVFSRPEPAMMPLSM